MATCTVTETIVDYLGAAVPSVVVSFTIPAPQMTSAGELLVTQTVTATSNASGLVSIALLRGIRALVTCRRLNLDNAPILVPDTGSADLGSLIDVGSGGDPNLGIPTLQQVLETSDPNNDNYIDAGRYAVYNFTALECNGLDAYIYCQGASQNTQITAASGNGAGDGIFAAFADGNQAHYFQSDRANNRGKINSGGNPFLIQQVNSQTAIMQGMAVRADSTGDMVDGFGSGIEFRIQDNAAVENTIGLVGAVRSGADNSGYLTFYTNNAGSYAERMRISKEGRVGIGGTPDAFAALDIQSTVGAFLPPRMTTAQRDALTPVNGMVIYNSTTNKFQGREAGAWVNLI